MTVRHNCQVIMTNRIILLRDSLAPILGRNWGHSKFHQTLLSGSQTDKLHLQSAKLHLASINRIICYETFIDFSLSFRHPTLRYK